MKPDSIERRNVDIFKFRLVYIILIAVLATGWVAGGVYCLAEDLLQDNQRLVFFVDLPAIVLGVATLWSLAWFRIECDDCGLLRREFRTRVIRFDLVKRLHFDTYGNLSIFSEDEMIKLFRVVERRDYLFHRVIEKVRGNAGLEITGESRWIETYVEPETD